MNYVLVFCILTVEETSEIAGITELDFPFGEAIARANAPLPPTNFYADERSDYC
jgi:hypothetical protein